MKSILRNLAILATFIVITTAGMPKEKNPIIGNYRLVKAIANGQPVNNMMMDRTMSYKDDNTFSGKITFQNKEMPSNQGNYFVENDSLLIMHQSTIRGELYKIAFVYNYKITGDTLNIKGYYTRELIENPKLPMQMKYYIDEFWVRINGK